MTRSFHHDQTNYTPHTVATLNGKQRRQWKQWRLMSGAYVLIGMLWLPTRSTRQTIINEFSSWV